MYDSPNTEHFMRTLVDVYDKERSAQFVMELPELRKGLACKPFSKRDNSFGIVGSTFRAYRKWDFPPSTVYRYWANKICEELNPQVLAQEIANAEGFHAWHTSLADRLNAHWLAKQGAELRFAHLFKMIDLFIKWLSSFDFDCPELTQAFESHANSALDSQTLAMLNKCLSLTLPISKPSMGDIHCRLTYDFCQRLIGDFACHHGGTRLLFDYYAWREGGRA